MPRETINIEKFHLGMMPGIDAQDLPLDAAADSSNLDNNPNNGKLLGRPGESTVVTALQATAKEVALLYDSNGKVHAIYLDGTDEIRAVEDFLGTESESMLYDALTGGSGMVNFQNAIRVPDPADVMWVGIILHDQVGGVGSGFGRDATGLTCEKAALVQFDTGWCSAINQTTDTGGALRIDRKYFYGFALEYDRLQVGPLCKFVGGTVMDKSAMDIELVELDAQNNISPRVTGILVFRAMNIDNTLDVADSPYYYCGRIDFVADTGWGGTGFDKLGYTFTDDGSFTGPSYEEYTGCASTEATNFVEYEIACRAGGYLVVGNCEIADVPAVSHMLFKSKSNRPDMFNYLEDYLVLNTVPSCLITHDQRLYVFDEKWMYRIEPEKFVIEDIVEGTGCINRYSAISTDFGLFFAGYGSAYHFDGQRLHLISRSLGSAWTTFTSGSSASMRVVYHSATNSVLFIKVGSAPTAYVYQIEGKRWDYWTVTGCTDNVGIFTHRDGRVFLPYTHSVAVPKLKVVADDPANRASWVYVSPDITAGDPSQHKKFYKVITTGTGSPTIKISKDGANSFSVLGTEAISAGDRILHSLQIKIEGGGSVNRTSLSTVFRRMEGKR